MKDYNLFSLGLNDQKYQKEQIKKKETAFVTFSCEKKIRQKQFMQFNYNYTFMIVCKNINILLSLII